MQRARQQLVEARQRAGAGLHAHGAGRAADRVRRGVHGGQALAVEQPALAAERQGVGQRRGGGEVGGRHAPAFSWNLRILPTEVRGSSSTTCQRCGRFDFDNRSAAHAVSAATSSVASGAATT